MGDDVTLNIRSGTVSPRFIIVSFSIMVLVVITSAILHFQSFTTLDATSPLNPVSASFLKSLGGASPVVQTGLIINKFHEFDIIRNKFTFDGLLWFRFDPSMVSLETIQDISFQNGEILEKSKPYTSMIGDLLFVRYAIRASFQVHMNYAGFPDDDHSISLVLVHKGVSPSSFIFDATRMDFTVSDDMRRQGWQEYDRKVSTGYISSEIRSASVNVTITNPAASFTIEYRHDSMRDLITILLPMMVMFAITLCSFAMDPRQFWSSRVTLSMQSIVGLVAFRFVMESISPRVGYFMISDHLFLLFLLMYVVIFLANLIIDKLQVWQEKLLIIAANAIIALSCILLWINF